MSSDYLNRRLRRLFTFKDLHSSVPVPIRQVVQDEGWRLLFRSRIHPLYGFAVIRGHHKVMMINSDINHAAQRYVMAHEMAHEIAGDTGSLHLCGEWPWAHLKQENRADGIAAQLLVPCWAIKQYKEVNLIADACEVPEWLVMRRMKNE